MRKIIFSIPVTLDGFIEGPQRELDWVNADDELHDFYTDLLRTGDLVLFGRVTYELMVNYWPMAPTDPKASESMKRFANTLNPLRKLVYSKTLNSVGWNSQVVETFNPKDILELKSQTGKNILLSGGATMAQAFFNNGLVDEYIPVIQPVVIGSGKALFGGLEKSLNLSFLSSQRFRSGAVAIRYKLNGELRDPSGTAR
jgi:dihydrofolate reductase